MLTGSNRYCIVPNTLILISLFRLPIYIQNEYTCNVTCADDEFYQGRNTEINVEALLGLMHI